MNILWLSMVTHYISIGCLDPDIQRIFFGYPHWISKRYPDPDVQWISYSYPSGHGYKTYIQDILDIS